MGQEQSTYEGHHGGAHGANGEVKTCYYELLGVDRQATDEDIKKAYRKKALELHPDRNYGNIEETTKLFAEVQSAYEVLSDPQERAWYDSHRSAILRGQSEDVGEHYEHNVRVTTSEDIMRVFGKFNGHMDFSDSGNGFFTMLRDFYDTLAKEEALACDWEGLEPVDYPSFGHANDKYEDVVRPFYAIWNGFATKKTFSWMDIYRSSDAPDRRVRRMLEKENKRFRDEGIREFNETVRSLVKFVRKRDPRYIPNTQTDAERQKNIRDAATAQAARSRAANRARAAQEDAIPAWTHNDDTEKDVSKEEEEEQPPEEQLECVVCRKTFKSEQQFEAHERSNKHRKAVQRLKRQMKDDNQALDLEGETHAPTVTDSADGADELGGKIQTPQATDSANGPDQESVKELDEAARADAENLDTAVNDGQTELTVPNHSGNAEGTSDDPQIVRETSGAAPISNDNVPTPNSDPSSAASADDDYVSRDELSKRILGEADSAQTGTSTPQSTVDDLSQNLANSSINDAEPDSSSQPKVGKAKAKRAKKAAQENASQSAADFTCATCNAGFPSKSRLFNHIKDLGHARPVPKAANGGKGKKR